MQADRDAGCGVSLLGFLNSYWAMFLAVMLTGIGSALFHPDGGRMANYVAGEKKGRGLSNFSVGGNLGGAVGPMLAVGTKHKPKRTRNKIKTTAMTIREGVKNDKIAAAFFLRSVTMIRLPFGI